MTRLAWARLFALLAAWRGAAGRAAASATIAASDAGPDVPPFDPERPLDPAALAAALDVPNTTAANAAAATARLPADQRGI